MIVLLGSARGRWHVLGRSDRSDTRALTLSRVLAATNQHNRSGRRILIAGLDTEQRCPIPS